MYAAHFGFHRQPFHSADATRAFFVSESIRTILPQLLHALRSDLGIAVLTGVPGSGRTSLLRHLQQQLSNEGRVIVCSGASLGTTVELITVLGQASRMKAGSESPIKSSAPDSVLQATRLSAMEHMKRTAELWGPILLLIDDAQLVPLPVLNELRACTEEEWNGRDLVRCLVSAPVSFEEQLARAEYAEFGRRIRCHTFLQPFTSVESIRFLKAQIELAGGWLSQVFTNSALELIVTAAGGIPRCLSLLADETLVVAAECGEKNATEQSVRLALNRLQHLQYNWNASPDAGMIESSWSDKEDIAEEPIRQVAAATFSRPGPSRATLAPGVMEFGGPESRGPSRVAEFVRPAAKSPGPSVMESWSAEVAPTIAVSACEEDIAASAAREATPQSGLEFGIPQVMADVAMPERVTIGDAASALFEVGRRFFAESSEDSISIEDVDDNDIFDLLNADGEFQHEPWDVLSSPDIKSPADAMVSASVSAPGDDLEIFRRDAGETPLEPDATEPVAVASDCTASIGFIDLGDSRMSNRTPVFDRYTWLALGREVPPGATSLVSPTSAKQLMLADCGMLATNHLATLCFKIPSATQTASMNPISITRTTDSALIDEISKRSPGREAGPIQFFRHVPRAVHEISDPLPADGDDHESQLRWNHGVVRDVQIDNRLHADMSEDGIHAAVDSCAEVLTQDEESPVVPGLRIWRDGQLIFAASGDSDSLDAAASLDRHSGSMVIAVSETAGTQPDPSPKLRNGGLFTLPIGNVSRDSPSPEVAEDQDVFLIVETLSSLRADMHQFQQSGRISDSDSGGTERVSPPDADLLPDPDSLISRAIRRLDDRTTIDDSALVALQIVPDARDKRAAADAEVTTEAASSTGSAAQFSSLFTRLWQNRRQAAEQTKAIAEVDR